MKTNNVTGNMLKIATIRKTLLPISLVSTFGEIQAQNPVHPPPYTLAEQNDLTKFYPSLSLATARSLSPNPIGERNFDLFNRSNTLAANSPDIYCSVTPFGESASYKFHRTSFLSEISSYRLPLYQTIATDQKEQPFIQIGSYINNNQSGTAYCAHSPNIGVTAAHTAVTTPTGSYSVFKERVCDYVVLKNYSDDACDKDLAVVYPRLNGANFVNSPHQPFSLDISPSDVRSTLTNSASRAIYSVGVTGIIHHPFLIRAFTTGVDSKWTVSESFFPSRRQWICRAMNLHSVNIDGTGSGYMNGPARVSEFQFKNVPLGSGASGGPVIQIRSNSIVALGTCCDVGAIAGAPQPTTNIQNQYLTGGYVSRIPELTKLCNSARRAMGQLKPLDVYGYIFNRPHISFNRRFSASRGVFGGTPHDFVTIPIAFSSLTGYINDSQLQCINKYVFDPGQFVSELRVAKIAANGQYVPGDEHLTTNYKPIGHLILEVVHNNITYTSTGELRIEDIWRQYPCPSGSGQNKEKGGVPLRTLGTSAWPDLSKLRSLSTGNFLDIRGTNVSPNNTTISLTVKLYFKSSSSPLPTSALGLTTLRYEIAPSCQ